MNDIRYKLKLSKKDQSGKCPVFLEFNYNAGTLIVATGEKCQEDQWDAEKQKFRRSMPGYQEANESLELLRDKLRTAYRDARNADKPVTNDLLKSAITGKHKKRIADLPALFAEYLAARTDLKPATRKSMNNSLNRLRRYSVSVGGLRVENYTNDVHRALVSAMTADDLDPSSVGTVCKHLITFFRYCRDTLAIELHPKHADIKKENSQVERIFLTEADLRKLELAALPPSLARVRDAFLFQCLTGLRYADLWRLQSHNIEQRSGYSVICLVPEKSVSRRGILKRVEIPLLPGALSILERYAGNFRLLPVLSNQKYNDYIKEVAQIAGITDRTEIVDYVRGIPQLVQIEKWQKVSSHVARHTFATVSLMKGVPLEVVSKALGHSNLQTTMIYARVVDEWKNKAILSAWEEKAVL